MFSMRLYHVLESFTSCTSTRLCQPQYTLLWQTIRTPRVSYQGGGRGNLDPPSLPRIWGGKIVL